MGKNSVKPCKIPNTAAFRIDMINQWQSPCVPLGKQLAVAVKSTSTATTMRQASHLIRIILLIYYFSCYLPLPSTAVFLLLLPVATGVATLLILNFHILPTMSAKSPIPIFHFKRIPARDILEIDGFLNRKRKSRKRKRSTPRRTIMR